MEKPAKTKYPVHELLRRRWSPVAFSDRRVNLETIGSLLEAARWAPSSFNEQPWSFIVATKDDPTEYERLLAAFLLRLTDRLEELLPIVGRVEIPDASHAMHEENASAVNEAIVGFLGRHRDRPISPPSP